MGVAPQSITWGAGEATLIGAATGEEQTETSRAPVTAGRTEVLYCGLGVNVGNRGLWKPVLLSFTASQPGAEAEKWGKAAPGSVAGV